VSAALPGPDPGELTRYLTEHPDWAKERMWHGMQVWINHAAAVRVAVPPADEFGDERETLAEAAFTIARVELRLPADGFAEAVRRLAKLYDLAEAYTFGPADSKTISDVVRGQPVEV
jgi:hypothetical protein